MMTKPEMCLSAYTVYLFYCCFFTPMIYSNGVHIWKHSVLTVKYQSSPFHFTVTDKITNDCIHMETSNQKQVLKWFKEYGQPTELD